MVTPATPCPLFVNVPETVTVLFFAGVAFETDALTCTPAPGVGGRRRRCALHRHRPDRMNLHPAVVLVECIWSDHLHVVTDRRCLDVRAGAVAVVVACRWRASVAGLGCIPVRQRARSP